MMKLPKQQTLGAVLMAGLAVLAYLPLRAQSAKNGVNGIEPTWESLAENYDVPAWLVDGRIVNGFRIHSKQD